MNNEPTNVADEIQKTQKSIVVVWRAADGVQCLFDPLHRRIHDGGIDVGHVGGTA